MKRNIFVIVICFISAISVLGQDCTVCINEQTTLNSTITSTGTGTSYFWICTDGTASIAEDLVFTPTESVTCTLTVTNDQNCVFTEVQEIDVYPAPEFVIGLDECTIDWVTQNYNGQNCTSFILQKEQFAGWWVNVSVTIPFISEENTNYRIQWTCDCGVYFSNVVTTTECECEDFCIQDQGNCIIGSCGAIPPCGSFGPYDAYKSCDGGITYEFWQVITESWFIADDDCCYYLECTDSGVDYCSNVVCVEHNCNLACNDDVATSINGCNMQVTNGVTCDGTYNLQYYDSFSFQYVNYSSGTLPLPSSFVIPYNGSWRVAVKCNPQVDGCAYYSSPLNFNGCGQVPCTPPPTVSISNIDCVLTATVANCDGTPSYSWSNGDNTQSTTVTTGTFNITIAGCCNDPLVSQIKVNCDDPCENFTTSITGEDNLCVSEQSVYTSSSNGGIPAYSTVWHVNGSQVHVGTSYVFTPTSEGSYTISIQTTDGNGCVAIDNIVVTVDDCCCVGDPTLYFDEGTCTLTWGGCQDYDVELRLDGDYIPNATSPYVATENGSYSLAFSKSGCPQFVTNTVVVTGCGCAITLDFDATGTFDVHCISSPPRMQLDYINTTMQFLLPECCGYELFDNIGTIQTNAIVKINGLTVSNTDGQNLLFLLESNLFVPLIEGTGPAYNQFDCTTLEEGDVIEITVTQNGFVINGCDYNGPSEAINVTSYTITAQDLIDCCS